MKVRTRFAPSPTGHVHIGNMRVALYNWLFARHHSGKFLLRVEDTDRERSTDAAIQTLLAAMEWLGLDYDETPFYQHTRMQAHLEVANQLLEKGFAYKEDKGGLGQGECIIFKMPGTFISFNDAIKGTLTKAPENMQDFVIVRSNGTPVFHLANVLDDMEQGITHVIRGDDHVENTFRHIALYQALGAEIPQFAHLPMIVNAQGKPYSKRDGDAFVGDFQEKGFLPEALCNYLALLGWSPGDDREVMNALEMIEAFSLDRCQSSPAQFDMKKLEWMNGEYMQQLPAEDFYSICFATLKTEGLSAEPEYTQRVFALIRGRIKTKTDILPLATHFFDEEFAYDPKAIRKKLKKDGVKEILDALEILFSNIDSFTEDTLETSVKSFIEEKELNFGAVMAPLRIAVSGSLSGPDLFPMLEVLGQDRVLKRIARVKKQITEE